MSGKAGGLSNAMDKLIMRTPSGFSPFLTGASLKIPCSTDDLSAHTFVPTSPVLTCDSLNSTLFNSLNSSPTWTTVLSVKSICSGSGTAQAVQTVLRSAPALKACHLEVSLDCRSSSLLWVALLALVVCGTIKNELALAEATARSAPLQVRPRRMARQPLEVHTNLLRTSKCAPSSSILSCPLHVFLSFISSSSNQTFVRSFRLARDLAFQSTLLSCRFVFSLSLVQHLSSERACTWSRLLCVPCSALPCPQLSLLR